ncbi:MAG TPA: NifB/NifX family molybdenum-iron cluster-binding protein [Holophaga sp.]|nr:NifB/NifX family molybdenum-iron cluster-binding protein [Holophaga sp.]
MSPVRIALPSCLPGGLDAALDGHFGHCAIYTLVDVAEGRVQAVTTLPGLPHEAGGCLRAVAHLAAQGVTTLIAGGLGMRPLKGFNEAGIEVYRGAGLPDVGSAVQAHLEGALPRFTLEFACSHHAH